MRLMRTSFFSAASICTLIIGSGLAAPLQANAVTSAPRIDVNTLFLYKNAGYSGEDGAFLCFTGTDPLAPQTVVKSLKNNCEYHIYLQYPGGVHPFCVNPMSDRSDIGAEYQLPISVQIGPGTGGC